MRIWLVILALFVAACSKSEDASLPYSPYEPSGDIIGFTSKDNLGDESSRATIVGDDGFELGDDIGIFAFFVDNGVWETETQTPNFMYNENLALATVEREQVWTYSPTKYWSNDPADRFKFFAYFPYSANAGDEGITLSENNAKGYPTITFSPHADVAEQVDFLTATTELMQKQTELVHLLFDHQLTQVKFAAKVDGPLSSVDNVQITQISYDFDGVNQCQGEYTDSGFEWNLTAAASASQSYLISGTELLKQNLSLNTSTYTELVSEAGTMLLIPQKFENDAVEITINYNVTTTFDETLTFERVILVPQHELLIGKRMVYQFTIDLEDNYYIRLDGVSDEEWNNKELILELDDMYFNLTGNTRAYNWVDHTTDTERLTIGIEYETNLAPEAIKVEKVATTSNGELTLDADESMIFYTRDNIREILSDRLKVTLTFGSATRILYIDIVKNDVLIEFTVTVEPWDEEILDIEDLFIKFDVEVEEWESATGDNIFDGIIDVE